MNNATKRALFNARRRYNNARTRANGVPNSDPETKGRALNNVMNAAANYLTAVKGASAAMPPREEQRLTRRRLPPIPGRRPASVNVLMPPPLPSVPAPQANIRNRMRAAIMRHYGVANVPNANVDVFLDGHMEYNDGSEINTLYKEYQNMLQKRRGGNRTVRRQQRSSRKQRGGNGNNSNGYDTNTWQVPTPPRKEVFADQAVTEEYRKRRANINRLKSNITTARSHIKEMIPGSQVYAEAHNELHNLEQKLAHKEFEIVRNKLNRKSYALARNISFANKQPILEVFYGGTKVAGQTLVKSRTNSLPTIRATDLSAGKYAVTIWDADAPTPGFLHMISVNLSPRLDAITVPIYTSYIPPNPPSGVHRYFITLWKQTGGPVDGEKYPLGSMSKDTLAGLGRQVAETFFTVAADDS